MSTPPDRPAIAPESPEAELTRLKAELAEAKLTNQRYLQNVAHQLTAPLGAIKWNIEALKDPEVGFNRKGKLLSSIYSQATILVHLIKNFALMSNLEADHELGQFRDYESVDLFALCINLSNDFQPQAADAQIKISVDEGSFIAALQGKRAKVVKNLVAQAVSNLLENAVKYSEYKSEILIFAERVEAGDSPAFILTVRNEGIPINREEVPKLLDRGFRGSTAKSKVPAGTGIGLYLAKRVMNIHKGTVGIRTSGKESNFRLIFPLSTLVLGGNSRNENDPLR
jgi:signal transduction histidine kinase